MTNQNIQRSIQKIFANSASTDEIAGFGSMISGSPVYSDNPEMLQTSAYEEGWSKAVAFNTAPFLEEMNAVQYVISRNIAYLLQKGLPEYSQDENYFQYSVCQQSGQWYQSQTDNNLDNNPAQDDGTNWKPLNFIQIATDEEAQEGEATNVAINPAQVKNLISEAIVGGILYKGKWIATGQADYSSIELPVKAGYMYYVQGEATIGTHEWNTGDYLIINEDVPEGGTITNVAEINNVQSSDLVKLEAQQTLTNKTIDAQDNTILNLTKENFKEGEFPPPLPLFSTITSDVPLSDARLHLKDGSLLQGEGVYSDFVREAKERYQDGSNIPDYFTDEETWQNEVAQYGVCSKYVYDPENNTLRLPRWGSEFILQVSMSPTIAVKGNGMALGFTDGTNNLGLIRTGNPASSQGGDLKMQINAFGSSSLGSSVSSTFSQSGLYVAGVVQDASKSGLIADSSSSLSQIKAGVYYYVVVAAEVKSEALANLDNIAADLNQKADSDLGNVRSIAKSSKVYEELFFKPGETFSAQNWYCSGCITSSKNKVHFDITLPKSMADISKITCEDLVVSIRAEGAYLPSSEWDALSEAVITMYKVHDYRLSVVITSQSAFSTASKNNISFDVNIESIALSFS